MIIGGGGADIHAVGATATSAMASLTAASPTYLPGPSMHHPRMHLCATLLPDRTVLVNGGSGMEESHRHVSPRARSTTRTRTAGRAPRPRASTGSTTPSRC